MAVCIVLQVLVVGERRRFDDDLLEEFDGEISRDEGLDGDRYIVGVGALW